MLVLGGKGSWKSQEGRRDTPPPITRAPFLLNAGVEVQSLTSRGLCRLWYPCLWGAFDLPFPFWPRLQGLHLHRWTSRLLES